MEVRVQATEKTLTPEELRSLVPAAKLAKLAGKGQIRAYTLAHEGVTKPRIVGEGTQTLTWPRKVIEQLKGIVKEGTKFFVGHNADNSTNGRKSIGEVITTTAKEIAGKLHNIVIGHFPDDSYSDEYDVISMEANVALRPDNPSVVDRIKDFTGIAAASSNKESPAFPGAVLQATIQCFEPDDNPGEGKEKTVTFQEVQQFIKERNVFPHQLFNYDDMKNDRQFGKVYDKVSTLEADVERLGKEKSELEETSKSAIRKVEVTEAKGKLDGLLKEGFTDKQKTYIKNKFNPESLEELSEDSLKNFVDSTTKEFSEMAKLFGAENLDSESGSGDGQGDDSQDDDPVAAAMKKLEE